MRVTRVPAGGPSIPLRRAFLMQGGAVGLVALLDWIHPFELEACQTPITGAGWPSTNGWEHRTLMHFLNAVVPGDHGRPLFSGDSHPLRSGGDTSAGAYSSCALDVLYDPYYGVAGSNSRDLATALDWTVRLQGSATYFYKASQTAQLAAIDLLTELIFVGSGFQGAASLGFGAAVGALKNDSFTRVIGWPGPNGGYYDLAKHPLATWSQPQRLTTDGNMP